MKWFFDMIDDYAKSRGYAYGWQSSLCRAVGGRKVMTPQDLNGWLKLGKEPTLEKAWKIATALGWDFDRARPDYTPNPEDLSEPCARVKAGTECFVPEAPEVYTPMPAVWRSSRWAMWGNGKIFYVAVDGDSMSPAYMNGDIIVCSRFGSLAPVRAQPVIARVGAAEHTFKKWSVDGKGMVCLLPINTSACAPIIGKIGEIVPYAAVLGTLKIDKK